MEKNLFASGRVIRDTCSIPRLGRPSGEGNGNPLQYSCLENPTDRGAWRATVHRVPKSWTWLKGLSMHMEQEIKMQSIPFDGLERWDGVIRTHRTNTHSALYKLDLQCFFVNLNQRVSHKQLCLVLFSPPKLGNFKNYCYYINWSLHFLSLSAFLNFSECFPFKNFKLFLTCLSLNVTDKKKIKTN